MNVSKLFCAALLVGSLAMIGCGSDSGSGDNGGNGGAVCDFGTCADEGASKTACLMAYNDCLELGNSESQCKNVAEAANCEG